MQVSATLTPSTAPHVAAAIVAAYRQLRGRNPPQKESWLWPLALSDNETNGWASMYNWNVGNVTTTHDAAQWYYNPKVTAQLRFLSFPEATSGALSMLKALDQHGGIDAADAGNADGWQRALNGYLGSVYPPLWTRVTKLQDVQPENGYEYVTPPTTRNSPVVMVLGVGALAAAVGWGLYKMANSRPPEPIMPRPSPLPRRGPEPEFDYWSRL